jgi:hypothetical protein
MEMKMLLTLLLGGVCVWALKLMRLRLRTWHAALCHYTY